MAKPSQSSWAICLHMLDAQIREGTALIDAEEHLLWVYAVRPGIQPLVLRNTALQPTVGTRTGFLCILMGRWVFHALIKGHGNIAAQIGLDAHGLLRPHKDPASVDVGGRT